MTLGDPVPLVVADEVNHVLLKLFLSGREKAPWVTLWRWKFGVQVQRDFKQEELAVSGRDEKAKPTWVPEGPDNPSPETIRSCSSERDTSFS